MSKGISHSVVDRFKEHGITGEVFVCLSQDAEYLKELALLIPDRVKLRQLLQDSTCCNNVGTNIKHLVYASVLDLLSVSWDHYSS